MRELQRRNEPEALVPFDRTGLVARLGDDNELFQELFAVFVAHTREQLEALTQAVECTDLSAMGRIAHTLKGASAMVSAPMLRDAATRLEVAAENGDLEEAMTVLLSLVSAFADFQDALEMNPLRGVDQSPPGVD